MRRHHPLPTYTSLADLWAEMQQSSPDETLGEFMAGLVLGQYCLSVNRTVPALYTEQHLCTCSQCGVTELDADISDAGMCDDCQFEADRESELEDAHVRALPSRYAGSRL